MFEIKNLSAGYGGVPVLRDISLVIPRGQVTVIAGPNGCGKSTLLKALTGILPAAGSVLLEGQALLTLSGRERAQKVAFLPQNRQTPEITVKNLVLHGRFPYLAYPRCYRPEDHKIAEAAMAQMGIQELGDTPLNQLSGGQRQKAYIAMALAQDTPVILLDEPTTYLDIRHQLGIIRQAKELAAQGKTVVMVVHDLPCAMAVADKIVLIENGTVAAQGTPDEVFLSGHMDPVFGVTVNRIQTQTGWQYYCTEE